MGAATGWVLVGLGVVSVVGFLALWGRAAARLGRRSEGDLEGLRRRLERAERLALVGELAAALAHEIKNPLAPIRGYAELLEARLSAIPEAERPAFAKGLRIIREESERIHRRVADLLELARGSAEDGPLGRTSLPALLAEVAALSETTPGIRRLELDVEPGVAEVRGDPEALRSALVNLVDNAAEAMAPAGGGPVRITARRAGAEVLIEIVDEGPGLGSGDPEEAFRPFYTTKPRGTGLGLAIARTAVEAAGGRLALEDRSDRAGAVARLWVPIAQRELTS